MQRDIQGGLKKKMKRASIIEYQYASCKKKAPKEHLGTTDSGESPEVDGIMVMIRDAGQVNNLLCANSEYKLGGGD